MTPRIAHQVEVGVHENLVGFTIHYVDGDKAHFLFGKDIAAQLAGTLLRVIEDLDYLERQMATRPGDKLGVSDRVNIELTPPAPSSGDDIGITSGN